MDLSWRQIWYILAGTVIITELVVFLVTSQQKSDLRTQERHYTFTARSPILRSDIENELEECKKKKYTCGRGLESTNGKCEILFSGEYEHAPNACLDRDSISNQKKLDLFEYVERKGNLPRTIRSGYKYAYCTPDLRKKWRESLGLRS